MKKDFPSFTKSEVLWIIFIMSEGLFPPFGNWTRMPKNAIRAVGMPTKTHICYIYIASEKKFNSMKFDSLNEKFFHLLYYVKK